MRRCDIVGVKVVVAFASDRPAEHSLGNVRLAMGSIAPVPMRLREVESLIESEPLTRDLADRAALIEKIRSENDIVFTAIGD